MPRVKSQDKMRLLAQSETQENMAVFRKVEAERIRQGNIQLARRIADVNNINAKGNVIEEIERYKEIRDRNLEQAVGKRDPKLSRTKLNSDSKE
jgi:recombinational DNA repair protein RecT